MRRLEVQPTLKFAAVSMTATMLAVTVSAQQRWTVTGQTVPELAAVDQMMRDIMQTYNIRGGSVAIAKDGRLDETLGKGGHLIRHHEEESMEPQRRHSTPPYGTSGEPGPADVLVTVVTALILLAILVFVAVM